MNKEVGILISVAVITIGIVVGVVLNNKSTDSNVSNNPAAKTVWRDDAPRLGSATAKTKIVEFADFQCPACAAMSPIIQKIVKEKPDTYQLEFRNYPLDGHKNALDAAVTAEIALKNNKFWEMDNLLYSNQNSWSELDNVKDAFAKFAVLVGIDETQFINDYQNRTEFINSINVDKAAGDNAGIGGTPTFFINGVMYTGDLSEAALRNALK